LQRWLDSPVLHQIRHIRDILQARTQVIWDFANHKTRNFPLFALRVFRQFNGYRRHEAASFAYWALFALFPVIILITLVTESNNARFQIRTELVRGLSDFIPLGEMKVIQDSITDVMSRRQVFGTVGIIGLIIGGLGLFGELRGSLAHIFGKGERHTWYSHILVYIGMVVTLGLLVVLSAAISIRLRLPLIYWFGSHTPINGPLTTILIYLIHAAMFALIYRYMPQRRVKWRWILPGALTAALAWDISRALFDWYLGNFQNLSGIYGSLGLVVGLLVWFFFTGNLILLGGEIIVALEDWYAAALKRPEPLTVTNDLTLIAEGSTADSMLPDDTNP
jgi:membrane protein